LETTVIGFSDNILRFLKINSSRTVTASGETDIGFSINDVSYFKKNKDDLLNVFHIKVGELLKDSEFKDLNTGVIIESSQTFLITIPVDFTDNENSINSHLLWELSNYFPDTYKNYSVRFLKLRKFITGENLYDVLMIAIDKNKLNFIKSLCNGTGIKIKNIEIDQFASEKCISDNCKIKGTKILLAGFKKHRIDFSITEGNKIIYYNYGRTVRQNYLNVSAKLLNSLKTSASAVSPDKIFIYGDSISEELNSLLFNEFGKQNVNVLSPFDNQKEILNSSAFAPLFGLALKNLT